MNEISYKMTLSLNGVYITTPHRPFDIANIYWTLIHKLDASSYQGKCQVVSGLQCSQMTWKMNCFKILLSETMTVTSACLLLLSCRALSTLFDVLCPRHKWTILHCQRALEPLHSPIGATTFIILTKGKKQLPQHLTAFSHLQILE